ATFHIDPVGAAAFDRHEVGHADDRAARIAVDGEQAIAGFKPSERGASVVDFPDEPAAAVGAHGPPRSLHLTVIARRDVRDEGEHREVDSADEEGEPEKCRPARWCVHHRAKRAARTTATATPSERTDPTVGFIVKALKRVPLPYHECRREAERVQTRASGASVRACRGRIFRDCGGWVLNTSCSAGPLPK